MSLYYALKRKVTFLLHVWPSLWLWLSHIVILQLHQFQRNKCISKLNFSKVNYGFLTLSYLVASYFYNQLGWKKKTALFHKDLYLGIGYQLLSILLQNYDYEHFSCCMNCGLGQEGGTSTSHSTKSGKAFDKSTSGPTGE